MSLENWKTEKYKTPVDKTLETINDWLGRNLTQIEVHELGGFLRQRRLGKAVVNTDAPSFKAYFAITSMLGEHDINQLMIKLRNDLPVSELKREPIIKNEKNKSETDALKEITVEDIPIYMTGDAGGFDIFKEQTDKAAEKVLYYNAKDNRNLFDDRNDTSDAEIIIKKEDKTIPEDDKKNLFNVLHLYLKAYGLRGRSVTTIGIKIPEGIDPSPFMKKLAQEAYEADVKIGALNFQTSNWKEKGWRGEFLRRQDELKTFAQKQFLKYINEQISEKKP